jgi:hypothetical protein
VYYYRVHETTSSGTKRYETYIPKDRSQHWWKTQKAWRLWTLKYSASETLSKLKSLLLWCLWKTRNTKWSSYYDQSHCWTRHLARQEQSSYVLTPTLTHAPIGSNET